MSSPPLDRLAAALDGEVLVDPAARDGAGRDGSHLRGRPAAVVRPGGPEDVVRIVRWARRSRVPLVPRGAGTSLDGESVPPDGAVAVDLSGWRRILAIDPDELTARVEPGVVNFELQTALRPQGLFYPPNPGSWTRSTIGGNIATNASGPRSFRYGPTRSWVRRVEVVLGTGERVALGTPAAKRSVGPELLSLLVGSEGSLGIVTEATLRLVPTPAVREGLVVPLPEGTALGALALRLRRARGTGLSAIEYLDRACADALAARRRAVGPTDAALLLLELEADDRATADARRRAVVGALRDGGIEAPPTLFDDADELWTLRGESGVVLDERYGERVREDVAVPLSRLDEMLRAVAAISAEEAVPVFLFAHLGEGSLHPNFGVDPASRTAQRVRTRLWDAALALGGTISGEHGIGRLKRGYVARELGAGAVAWLADVKRHCDPDGILNPGTLYPPRAPVRGSGRSRPGGGAARRPSVGATAGSGRGLPPPRRAARRRP